MLMEYRFEKLEIWQLSMQVVDKIYTCTKTFPVDERYALTSQLRRAATSIVLNIAEGSGRKTNKDFSSFIHNSMGSTLEVIACLKIAVTQHYMKTDVQLDQIIQALYFKLIGFNKTLS